MGPGRRAGSRDAELSLTKVNAIYYGLFSSAVHACPCQLVEAACGQRACGHRKVVKVGQAQVGCRNVSARLVSRP